MTGTQCVPGVAQRTAGGDAEGSGGIVPCTATSQGSLFRQVRAHQQQSWSLQQANGERSPAFSYSLTVSLLNLNPVTEPHRPYVNI